MIVIGIDPGITGGIAAIKNGRVCAIHDMPTQAKGNPVRKRSKSTGMMVTKQKKEVDPVALTEMLNTILGYKEEFEKATIYLEQVSAGVFGKNNDGSERTQGVTSAFSLGDSYGLVRGVVGALEHFARCKLETVRPQTWKSFRELVGKEKDEARILACRLYPNVADLLKRKKDIGRGDALMIADYAYAKEIGVI